MTDEKTLMAWAFGDAMDAAKEIHRNCPYSAVAKLRSALMWLEQAGEAKTAREAKEAADKIAAAYTDLADAA